MVTHGGRCPHCRVRTLPGIGARAGKWICPRCQQAFDAYGRPADTSLPAGALRRAVAGAALALPHGARLATGRS